MKKWRGVMALFALLLVFSFSTRAFAAEKPEGKKDIVDTAVEAGNFTILAAALEKTDLVETLKGEGPYTVFAPTDKAFKKLMKQLGVNKEELLARPDLKDILLYHVVSGNVMSKDLKDGMKVETLANKEITVSLDPIKVNDAKVIKPDIMASNGVIHVINKVLIPKE